MKSTLNVGDQVRLKARPEQVMTIREPPLGDDYPGQVLFYWCEWSAAGSKRAAWFPERDLELVRTSRS